MNEMQIFNNEEFGEVRTLMIDGEAWFVGKDICRALGYVKPTQAVHNNVDSEDTLRKGLLDARGIMQDTIVINESGLYSLIFSSKLESAKRFKKWVTSEVLPSIRKTGSYGAAQVPQLPQSPMELLELHYQAIKEVNGRVDKLSGNLDDVRSELQAFKDDMPVLGIEESRITNAVRKKGVECLGGKNSNAYKDRSLRGKLYSDMYGQLKRQFGVSSYKAIKRNQCDLAIQIIEQYEPPFILKQRIEDTNAQMTMEECA